MSAVGDARKRQQGDHWTHHDAGVRAIIAAEVAKALSEYADLAESRKRHMAARRKETTADGRERNVWGLVGHAAWVARSTAADLRALLTADRTTALTARIEQAKGEALREAADDLYGDDRAANSVHSHPLSVGNWLRERAARIACEADTSGGAS